MDNCNITQIVITQNDDFLEDRQLQTVSNTGVTSNLNITGYVFNMGIKASIDDTTYSVDPTNIIITITDAVNGIINISIARTYLNLSPGTYFFDIQWLTPANKRFTFDWGEITILKEITTS